MSIYSFIVNIEVRNQPIIPVLGGLLALSTIIILILSLVMIAIYRKKGEEI